MSTEELEAKRKEEQDAKAMSDQHGSSSGEKADSVFITSEMRSMIKELIDMCVLSSNKPVVQPVVQLQPTELKLELVPNDVRLEGSKNYLSWSRRVRVLLAGKHVENYLEETCVEPADKNSAEWQVWYATNSVIVAWLLASMLPSVAKNVEAMRMASQIWETLSSMYSRKGNVMAMMEVQGKVDAVKQAGRSVEQYAYELRYLWEELDYYAPLQMETPRDAQAVHKWVQDRRVIHFLKNLDPEFESRRVAFCHQASLPTMNEAVKAMSEEENRLRMMGNNNPMRPAYVAVEDRECYNCGEKGHMSYNCPNPGNRGGRGGARGGRWGTRGSYGGGRGNRGGGRGRGRVGPRANVAMTEEAPSITLTGEQVKQWEQWQKGKAPESSTPCDAVNSHTSNFGNLANYAHMGEGEGDWEKDWNWSQA